MKAPNSNSSSGSNSGGGPNWVWPIVIAICAAGAGISGTLLWMQSRAPVTLTPLPLAQNDASANSQSITPSASTSSAPNALNLPQALNGQENSPANGQTPPPHLTDGLSAVQAALMLGNWHYDHQQWNQAVVQYRKALSGGLDNADVRTDLGNAYRFSNRPQDALAQYRIAQKQNPQHENSLFNQGGLYAFSLNDPRRAIQLWRGYLQKFPQGQNAADARKLIAQAQKQESKQAKKP